jgi:predicted alpha/beta hydrolase
MTAAQADPVRQQAFTVTTGDGCTLRGDCFLPPQPRASLVIASALGVPRRLYASFAAACAVRGLATFIFDYRGIGDSAEGVRGAKLRMQDWGTFDIDAVLAHAQIAVPGVRRLYLGHSCGGQLIGLAPRSEALDAAVFVAASAPRANVYPWPDRGLLMAMWHVALPLLAIGRDYLPGRGRTSAAPFPSGVSREWAAWASSAHYLFDPKHGIDTRRYAQLSLPILSLGFDDDRYAPPAAIDALLAHFPRAAIERRRVTAREAGAKLGHFGFFRSSVGARLWPAVIDWLSPA